MMLDQAAAAVTLWRSRQWDTADIARVLDAPDRSGGGGDRAVSEADVVRVLDAVRSVEQAPDLRVVRGD